jgi:DNA-binding protein HU-beta
MANEANGVNREVLVSMMAETTGFTKKDSKVALEAMLSCVQTALANGESVKLAGFGTFKIKETAARVGRNPKTGEQIAIPAGTKPTFSFSTQFKDAVKA